MVKRMLVTRDDVRAVAERRFYKRYRWHFIGALCGWTGISFTLGFCLPPDSIVSLVSLVFSLAGFAVGLILFWQGSRREFKRFMARCRGGVVLVYTDGGENGDG